MDCNNKPNADVHQWVSLWRVEKPQTSTLVSKKGTEMWEESKVNLIVLWAELRCCTPDRQLWQHLLSWNFLFLIVKYTFYQAMYYACEPQFPFTCRQFSHSIYLALQLAIFQKTCCSCWGFITIATASARSFWNVCLMSVLMPQAEWWGVDKFSNMALYTW